MRVHHIAMRTDDPGRLEAFYARLGLPVVARQGERSVWLDAGGAIVMLERAAPGEPRVPAGSMELVAFAVDATEKDRLERALAADGVAVEARTAHTIYVRDPDGRRVGLSSHPGMAALRPGPEDG